MTNCNKVQWVYLHNTRIDKEISQQHNTDIENQQIVIINAHPKIKQLCYYIICK